MNLPHPNPLLIKEREHRRVVAFGTFDIFHPGHENYLKQSRRLGDKLFVIVARDETVKKVKGKLPRNSEEKRLQVVKESGLADEARLGSLENQYEFLESIRPDVIALGYDQKADGNKLKEKIDELGMEVEIARLEAYRPEIYKSSKMG